LLPGEAPAAAPHAAAPFPGWPAEFDGRPLGEVALTSVERSFYRAMPGRVAQFTDGPRRIVMRWSAERDRRFHMSASCWRAKGYALSPLPDRIDALGRRWGAFEAWNPATFDHRRVLERIVDGDGREWTDEKAFRWHDFWLGTRGPWTGVTVAEPM
jgi:hypothetical protein